MISRRCLSLILAVTALPTTVVAQEVDLKFGGQVRPRFEFRDPLPFVDGSAEDFVSMRTRFDVRADLVDNVGVFVQVQDVRLWGSERNTLADFSAEGLDIHQAYVDLGRRADGKVLGRFGRQEVNFGGQRLIGSVNWTQQARSFDGIRVGSAGSVGAIDVLLVELQDAQALDVEQEAELLSAYGTWDVGENQDLDLYWIFDRRDDDEDEPGDTGTSRHTLGARWVGSPSDFRYRFEGSYQAGKFVGRDVSAFMAGGRLAYALGKGTVTLWYDYLSGSDDPATGDLKVFDTLFATNHKFYGFADIFLNIPAHTGGYGLQDLALKGTYRPHTDWTLRLDLHAFRTARQGSLSTNRFGEEIDIVAAWKHSRHVTLSGGFSYVFQGDALAEVGRLDKDMTWVYIMLDAKF